MKRVQHGKWWITAAAALMALPLLTTAQTEDRSDADQDPGTDTTLVPRPAEMAPRAARTLLLDVTRAGSAWVAVGSRGIVLRSEDGQHWKQQPCPVDATLTRVRFTDADHGWAVGYDGSVLATTDGGRHWELRAFDANWGKPWFDLRFTDAQTGWLLGANGALKRSTDGGATWTAVEADAFQDQPNLYALSIAGDGTMLIVGERGFMARSTDQGATWQRLRSPYTGSLFGAVGNGPAGMLVFGLRGHVFHADALKTAPAMSAADIAAAQAAANDAASAAQQADPVTAVPGWTELANSEHESLFGGTPLPDGGALLFGANSTVLRIATDGHSLQRLALRADSNLNTGSVDGEALVAVGTAGIRRLSLH